MSIEDEAMRRDVMANWSDPEPVTVRFGPAKGNAVPLQWAAWMMTEWRNAELNGSKPPPFSATLARASVHFLNEME